MARLRSRRSVFLRAGAVVILSIALWFWPVGKPTVAPSFDCTKASGPTEKTICADPELARIDADFALYYQDNIDAAQINGDSAVIGTLRQGQRAFVEARNQCGTVKWCIERRYADRDRQLAELVGAPHRPVSARGRARPSEHLGDYLIKLLTRRTTLATR
jgi:uncharacterized protein